MELTNKVSTIKLTPENFLNASRWLIVASAVAISLPTPLIGLTTGLFLLTWISIAVKFNCFSELVKKIINHPIALPALLLWLFFGIGILWSSASSSDAWRIFGKYRELLLLPLMLSILTKEWTERIIYGFIIGHMIGMIFSFFQWFGYFNITGMPSGFHSHIQYSTLEAFAIFAITIIAYNHKNTSIKISLFILAFIMLFNLFMINTGRSGYIVFFMILAVGLLILYRWQGMLIFFLTATISVGILYSTSAPFQARINSTIAEVKNTKTNMESTAHSRPVLWINALNIIKKAPIFGHGTGSFLTEYRQISTVGESKNPHQQYLLVWAELGIIGLLFLLYLYYRQVIIANHMEPKNKYLAYCLLVTFLSHTLFNSALMDNVEGHFYAILSAALWADNEY